MMTQDALISVIVPIYKVEPWLKRCVDSIRNQTYRNLEIILVDDGSPDRCGKMCDDFAKEDSRICVIHQQNGGLSVARNTGLDNCHGEYIGFVDSDDCIHPEMYQRLYDDICTFGTQLAFCQPKMCYDDDVRFDDLYHPTEVMDKHSLIHKCLKEIIWFSACTKLYHRSLFKDVRYPAGRTNEDYPTTIPIYSRAGRVAVNYNKMYAYCKRRDSITTAAFNLHSFDQLKSAEEVYHFIKINFPDCSSLAHRHLQATAIGLLLYLEQYNSEFEFKRAEVLETIRRYYDGTRSNPYLSFLQKLLLASANMGTLPYAIASHIYRLFKR